jgi:type I restriction enzyme, S subunit
MKSNYKKLGQFIQQVSIKNSDLRVDNLLGVSITKKFIKSIANTIGTDMTTYKIVKKNQFTYGSITSRNGDKISIALLEEDEAIVSTSYTVFEIIETNELLPEYLMMWFTRPEFDRYARYMSHGSTREAFGWDEMCAVELPVPTLEKQKEIIKEYHTIKDRIKLNEQLNQKLEDTAQSIYKEWFVSFEFPDENGKPYKSNGGEMVYCDELEIEIPRGWKICQIQDIAEVIKGKSYKSDELQSSKNALVTLKSFQRGGGYKLDGLKEYIGTYKENQVVSNGDLIIAYTDVTQEADVVGKPALVIDNGDYKQLIISLDVGLVKAHDEDLKYFLYGLASTKIFQEHTKSHATGTTVLHLGKDAVPEYKTFLPNEILLKKYISIIKPIYEGVQFKTIENTKLENLKEILLSKMATIEG